MAKSSTLPMLEKVICDDDETRAAVVETLCSHGRGDQHDAVVKRIVTPGHPPLPDLAAEIGCSHSYVYRTWHEIRDFCVQRFLFKSCHKHIFSPLNTTALLLGIVPCSSNRDKFEKICKYSDELAQELGMNFVLDPPMRRRELFEQICAAWREDDRELAETILCGGAGVAEAARRHNCPPEVAELATRRLEQEVMARTFWSAFDDLIGLGDLRTLRVTVEHYGSVDQRVKAMRENIRQFCDELFTLDWIADTGGRKRRHRTKATPKPKE